MATEGKKENLLMDCEDEGSEDVAEHEGSSKEVYLPGQPLNEDEELVHDPSAYVMLHEAQSGAPCLSFDIIPDKLGERRETFPLSAYIVAGTQAAHADGNNVLVMKMSNMLQTQKDKDDESDEEEEEDDDEEENSKTPHLECARIRHVGCVNRIRCFIHEEAVLAASWSELGQVSIYNLGDALQAVESKEAMRNYKNNSEGLSPPLFTFSGHRTEGFGLDWCSTNPGMLATGDCKRNIHIWRPVEGGTWHVDQRPLIGHTDSVEDLQWSPNENNVLASCSVDKSIRIWDTRAPPNKACMLTVGNAHESDVNVINWNRNEPFIVSGGDDGVLHIWDLRQFQICMEMHMFGCEGWKGRKPAMYSLQLTVECLSTVHNMQSSGSAVATFKHHLQPVTTVEWHPSEATIFASGGADDQIALWDLSLERDTDDMSDDLEKLPPQLLFIHQGQTDIKELHWHPQLTGVIISTALSGFNIFRTISV